MSGVNLEGKVSRGLSGIWGAAGISAVGGAMTDCRTETEKLYAPLTPGEARTQACGLGARPAGAQPAPARGDELC